MMQSSQAAPSQPTSHAHTLGRVQSPCAHPCTLDTIDPFDSLGRERIKNKSDKFALFRSTSGHTGDNRDAFKVGMMRFKIENL